MQLPVLHFLKKWRSQDIVVNLFCNEVVIPYQYPNKRQAKEPVDMFSLSGLQVSAMHLLAAPFPPEPAAGMRLSPWPNPVKGRATWVMRIGSGGPGERVETIEGGYPSVEDADNREKRKCCLIR
jgi:hypothetical protein